MEENKAASHYNAFQGTVFLEKSAKFDAFEHWKYFPEFKHHTCVFISFVTLA